MLGRDKLLQLSVYLGCVWYEDRIRKLKLVTKGLVGTVVCTYSTDHLVLSFSGTLGTAMQEWSDSAFKLGQAGSAP